MLLVLLRLLQVELLLPRLGFVVIAGRRAVADQVGGRCAGAPNTLAAAATPTKSERTQVFRRRPAVANRFAGIGDR